MAREMEWGKKQQPESDAERFFREVEIEFLIHELKDPIAVIETGLRTILEKRDKFGPLTSRQEKTVRRALRNTHKARQMLNGLLEIGRSETGCFVCRRFQPAQSVCAALLDALETISAATVVDGPVEADGRFIPQFLEANGIFLDISPDVADLEIFQDEVKFKQIIGNLIKNAIHHRQKRVDIRLYRASEQFCVEVIDDGPGVDPNERELIFQRYAQGKECRLSLRNGHGLGLAGARIIARCLGGEIELETPNNRGATFRMRLPVSLSSGKEVSAKKELS
jgi:signal transduction histidine kinase